MSRVAEPATPKASDEEILAAYMQEPAKGISGASVKTGVKMSLVSAALKRMGVVSNYRAAGAIGDIEGGGAGLDHLTERDWQFVAGVFFAQKRGVYVNGKNVRIYMTISNLERMAALGDLLRVGELNTFHTNRGKNMQVAYRLGAPALVRRFLLEMKKRNLGEDRWIDEGLAVLNGRAG